MFFQHFCTNMYNVQRVFRFSIYKFWFQLILTFCSLFRTADSIASVFKMSLFDFPSSSFYQFRVSLQFKRGNITSVHKYIPFLSDEHFLVHTICFMISYPKFITSHCRWLEIDEFNWLESIITFRIFILVTRAIFQLIVKFYGSFSMSYFPISLLQMFQGLVSAANRYQ